MKLMLYIGNKLIETINLDASRISHPGYLGQFKRTLKLKYKELIAEQKENTNFLVVATVEEHQQKRLVPIQLISSI